MGKNRHKYGSRLIEWLMLYAFGGVFAYVVGKLAIGYIRGFLDIGTNLFN